MFSEYSRILSCFPKCRDWGAGESRELEGEATEMLH